VLAAIPFIGLGVYNLAIPGLGTLPIDPWATLVCIGFVVGLEVARHRGMKYGMEPRDIVDGAVVIVLTGFFVAHVVTVVFYFPERMMVDGAFSITAAAGAIGRVWQGFASTGGFLGAVIGAWIFYGFFRKVGAVKHADVICYGFPFGWLLGRMGCGLVHDHVGKLTDFPLAMNFDQGFGPWAAGASHISGIRHELGLYEAAYMVLVCGLFLWLGRQERPVGFFLATFAICYAPVRFFLDFLRNTDLGNTDLRYGGLTPAQYGMIVLLLAGIAFLAKIGTQVGTPEPAGAPE
jgi:phosphatidylglycerol---prolipoprotein diacylglyceryl transferase